MQHASTRLILWRVLAHLSTSMSIHVVYTDAKPYRCAIAHKMRNFARFSPWKWDTLLPYSHSENLVRIAFCVLWCTCGETLLDFRHENKVKCCWIFAVEIWHWFQTCWENIDWDHNHSKIKPQSPTHLKHHKLMPIAYFQLSMSKNYGFTKTKDCPWTNVVGCLTPYLHLTRLLNSRIKIFYPSILD